MVLLASVTVATVIAAAGFGIGVALKASMTESVAVAAVSRAQDIAAAVQHGAMPATFPVLDDDEAFVQVVRSGDVVAASSNIAGQAPLALATPPVGEVTVHDIADLPLAEDEGGFRVAVASTVTPQGPTTVYVAGSLEDVHDTIADAIVIAAGGLPLVIVALALAMWLIVGRTLEPVDRIRREADAIGGQDLHRRVPEPDRDDEIGRLARTLNAMLARVEGSAVQQRRFVADAAHELRSPIASLRAQLETAPEVQSPLGWRQRTASLLDETLRMQRLTEQLLLLARLDAAEALRRRPVDLDDIVVTVAGRLRGDPGVALDVSQVRPVQVAGDAILLEQLATNLVENAIRHAHKQVRVRVGHAGGQVFVEVEDDGAGIPVDRRGEVLRPFTRLDDARDRDSGGAGLGLAIAADIARAHGGLIEIGESALGGARVGARIPGVEPPHEPN